MHTRTLRVVGGVSLLFMASGVVELIRGKSENGLSLLVLGLCCGLVLLLLSDLRLAVKPRSVKTPLSA